MPASPSDERLLKQALEWFFLLQSENCNDENRRQFSLWYHKNEANQAAYAHAEHLWSDLNKLKETKNIPGLEKARQVRPKRQAAQTLRLIAFIFVASALISIGWIEHNTETVIYATQLGEQRKITLSDGSTVDLNTATRLQARISPLQRKITLDSGEATFDVQHEWIRTFDVYAGKLKIRDIGTRFNVKLHNDAISVAVLQGAVEINGERLGEGYQREYQLGIASAPFQLDIEQAEAWKHGRLVFRQASMREVVSELERYHPVHFVFAEPSIAHKTLSGTFGTNDLELFLQSIEKIIPIKVRHLDDKKTLLIDWKKRSN